MDYRRQSSQLIALIICAACLLLNLRLLYMTAARSPRVLVPDLVSSYENRFRLIGRALPRAVDIGYVTDASVDEQHPAAEGTVDFYLTQYVLVPRVVHPDTSESLVVGNFIHLRKGQLPQQLRGLAPVMVSSDGTALYRTEAR
jgi:hypothetical protein